MANGYNTFTGIYKRYPAIVTAMASMLIALCSSLPTFIINNALLIDGDYCMQYIPFFIETRRMIEGGLGTWSWNCNYGANFIGTYSYYTLFNPFSCLVLPFQEEHIADAMYLVMLLKFAVGAYIAFCYLRLFVGRKLASLGSLLYVYSSYTLSVLCYYNFMDAAMLYPLILIAIERFMMLNKKDYGFISIAFFINAIAHYYLFVGSLIGTILYCIIRLFSHDWHTKTTAKTLYVISMSILGTLLASFIFLPALFALSGCARESQPISVGVTTSLIRLLSLIFPLDSRGHSLIPWGGSFPPSCCLPVVSITFALCYIIKKPRNWLSVTLLILCVCMTTPYLSGAFNLYTEPAYSRWLYMPVLMLSLASVLYMSQYGSKTKLSKRVGWGITIIAVASIIAIHLLMHLYHIAALPTQLQEWCRIIINDYQLPITTIGGKSVIFITILYQILLLIYLHHKRLTINHLILFVAIGSIALYSSYYNNYFLQMAKNTQTIEYDNSHAMTHRYSFDIIKTPNSGLYTGMPGPNYYHSIINHNLQPLYKMDMMDFSMMNRHDDAFYAFGSVKYKIKDNNNTQYPGATVAQEPFDYYIPMGYTYDTYLTESQASSWYQQQDSCNLYHLMLATLVVADDAIEQIPAGIQPYNIPDTLPSISTLAHMRNNQHCHSFEGTKHGFTADIYLDRPNIVFFSIPCDKGFSIEVNGMAQQPIKSNFAFIGVVCSSGHNHIQATYHTPLLHEGIILSGIALCLIIIALLVYYRLGTRAS